VVDYDFVPDGYITDISTNCVNDPGNVATANVEIVWLSHLLSDTDHVDRDASGGPNVIEVDPRGHYANQYLVRFDFRDIDFLYLEGRTGIAESVLANDLREHFLGNFPNSG
jgi:hypothetical protein